MELMEREKAGFKKTDIGLIPQDWSTLTVGKVASIFGRIGFRGYTINDIVKEDQGAITISPSNIINGKFDFRKATYISWFKYDESPEIKIYNGDILLVKTGSTFGKTALVKNLDKKATINPQLVVLKKTKCDNVFLSYLMNFPIIQDQINASIVGGAIPTLSQEQISRFQIALPPTLEEQKAIATALSDTDALIAGLEKLIAKKKAIKRGAMQQLLTPPQTSTSSARGGKRLPGFSGEWEEKRLGEIADIKTGSKNNQDKIENGVYPFYVRSQTVERINSYSYDCEAILIPGEGGIGTIFHYINGKFDVHQRVYKISGFSQNVIGKFIYYQLVQNFYEHAMKNSVKATVDSLRLPTFQEYEISLPSNPNEQSAIVGILDDMESEIEVLESKKAKYEQVKQGMMQELFTGKTRLV